MIIPMTVQSIDDYNKTTYNTTKEEAIVIVNQFLLYKEKNNDFSICSSTSLYNNQQQFIGYIFNLSPVGYIIISPSKDMIPIKAYSFTSDTLTIDQTNPLLALVSADISNQQDILKKIPQDIKTENRQKWNEFLNPTLEHSFNDEFQQWPPEDTTKTEGWIETQWGQYEPYNNFCPMDPTTGYRSIAGCPSIAMAQILHYHQTTKKIQFDDSDDYHHNYLSSFWIDNDHVQYDFPSFPVLNDYLIILEDHYENDGTITEEDLAALVFGCGIAAEQVYSSQGSGTYGVHQAYDAYQRFNCYNTTLYYTPDDTIYNIIIDNIKNALPVHFAVVNSQWNSGHNLIIDGYNTDDYFHLNFGWDGESDGWYFLPQLPYGFTVIEGVIVDILKKTTSEDLSVEGSLIWQNQSAGDTVTGSFTVENIGDINSVLSWEITTVPDWGEWTITPSNGHSLRPIDGEITIQVSCVVPDEQRKTYSDSITIINSNNPSDREFIPITLSLPKNKHPFMFKDLWLLFPLLQDFLKILLKI